MKNILKYIIIFLFLFPFCACTSLKKGKTPVIIEEKIVEKTIIKDSIIVKDSIVYIPQEKIVEVVPHLDTLQMEIETAKAKAYLDTTRMILKGELESKKATQKEVIEVTKIVEKIDTVFIEKPVPYEVIKEVKYIPKAYKYSMWFSLSILAFFLIKIFLTLKRKFTIL